MAAPLRAARTVARSPRPMCHATEEDHRGIFAQAGKAGTARPRDYPSSPTARSTCRRNRVCSALRRHGQPDEIVVAEPGVGEQPGRVRVEVHEGARSSVGDTGPLLDEPADGAQRLEEVVDALQVGGRRVAHERRTVCRDERERSSLPGRLSASKPTRCGEARGVLRRGRNRLPAPGSALETACTAAM